MRNNHNYRDNRKKRNGSNCAVRDDWLYEYWAPHDDDICPSAVYVRSYCYNDQNAVYNNVIIIFISFTRRRIIFTETVQIGFFFPRRGRRIKNNNP